MNRNHFLKTTFLSGLALTYIPLSSFHLIQEKYSKNQLIGKGNSALTGDTYTSKMNKEGEICF